MKKTPYLNPGADQCGDSRRRRALAEPRVVRCRGHDGGARSCRDAAVACGAGRIRRRSRCLSRRAWLRTCSQPAEPFWEPATDALLPLFALSLLILPYLPWIADWMPALRLFAGPGSNPDLDCRHRPGAVVISSPTRAANRHALRPSQPIEGRRPLRHRVRRSERAVRAQCARLSCLRSPTCSTPSRRLPSAHAVCRARRQSRRVVRPGIRHRGYAPVLLLGFVGLPACCAIDRIDGSRSC